MKQLTPSIALVTAALLIGCGTEAGILVNLDGSGVAPAPIASLLVAGTALDDDWTEESVFPPADGEAEITLPTTFGLRLSGRRAILEGRVEVCVAARDEADVVLASSCVTEMVVPTEIVEFDVNLVFLLVDGGTDSGMESGIDSGVDSGADGGADAGIDGATDSGTLCGDGAQEPGEDCDGLDHAGEDCVSLGFSGGALVCDGTCMFDVSGCTGPPTVPVQRKPINASYLGSVHVPGSLRPIFVWEPSSVGGGGSITYEIDYSPDSSFPGAMTTTAMSLVPSHQPASDLPVSLAPPVGQRYYWRVRACVGMSCSAYSATWYVQLGRSDRDFNGDGYADAVVGATEATEPVMSAGAFYVFFGGPSGAPDATPDAIVGGSALFDRFGSSASPAGDVNGDGFTDLITGSQFSNAGGTDSGAAFLYFGGPGAFNTTADASWTGEAAGDELGTSVASAGDLNGDGYGDVVIGAFRHSSDSGRAYVYFGGPGAFDTTPEAIMDGTGGENFGWEVNTAGDVNGDGYADIIVGADVSDVGGSNAGAAHLFLGGPGATFDDVEDALMTGLTGDQFGISVDSAGDVNDDGYSDIIVGAYLADLGGSGSGAAYVYLGGPGAFNTTPDGTLPGQAASDLMGQIVARAGDVNGDGFDDVIVGAPTLNPLMGTGHAYVYFGGPGSAFDATIDATLTGAFGTGFGIAAGLAGDVNGDGFSDVIVGANFDNTTAPLAGAAFIYLGAAGATLNTVVDGLYLGTSMWAGFGAWVAELRVTSPEDTGAKG